MKLKQRAIMMVAKNILITLLLSLGNLIFASESQNLERHDSFKRVQDFSTEQKKNRGKIATHRFMNDITESGPSTRTMKNVSYKDFMIMNDEQIQNVSEVVIALKDACFGLNDRRAEAFNQQLKKNENITVVLDCNDEKAIDSGCLCSISAMRKLKINAPKVNRIRWNFLSGCSGLREIDLTPLSNVTRIGDSFLGGCSSLTALDLTPLSNVREIGNDFLIGCSGLTALDLTPLSNVRDLEKHDFFEKFGRRAIERILNERAKDYGDMYTNENHRPQNQERIEKHQEEVQPPEEYKKEKAETDYRPQNQERIEKNQEEVQGVIEDRPSYNDFMNMNDQQIQNVREVVIPLKDACFGLNDPRAEAFNQQLEKNQNITVVLDCGDEEVINGGCLNSISAMRNLKINAPKANRIGNAFLSGCSGLREIDLTPLSNVRSIDNNFLSGCSGLTALDLRPLVNIREIGNDFLAGCSGLKELNLLPLSKLKEIQSFFLYRCSGLKALDLRPLEHVTRIGNAFLSRCSGLTALDLRPLANVTEVGEFFISYCSGLKELHYKGLSNVKRIGFVLFVGCSNQIEKIVSQLRVKPDKISYSRFEQPPEKYEKGNAETDGLYRPQNQERIEKHQEEVQHPEEYKKEKAETDGLYRPQNQERIEKHQEEQRAIEGRTSYRDFMKMNDQQIQNVREVVIPLEDAYFFTIGDDPRAKLFNVQLEKNKNITVVLDFGDEKVINGGCLNSISAMRNIKINAPRVEYIGGNFLSGCSGLTALDLTPLSNVRRIDNSFLSNCSGLTSLDLTPLSNVRSIDNSFLYNCSGLTALDLTPLSNVRSIGGHFLSNCSGLRALDLSPLSELKEIPHCFLYRCSGLTALDLKPLKNVTRISDAFLSRCSGLIELDLSPLANVTEVGSFFLAYCYGLKKLNCKGLSNLKRIGYALLNAVPYNFLKGDFPVKEDRYPLK